LYCLSRRAARAARGNLNSRLESVRARTCHGWRQAYNAVIATREEAIMPESSIGFMLMLAIFVGIAMALATRYHTDHPLSDLRHWLGAHHRTGRTHRRH